MNVINCIGCSSALKENSYGREVHCRKCQYNVTYNNDISLGMYFNFTIVIDNTFVYINYYLRESFIYFRRDKENIKKIFVENNINKIKEEIENYYLFE